MCALKTSDGNLREILSAAEKETPLSAQDLSFLLSLREPHQQELLFQCARRLRQTFFSDRVFLYGFIYTSTYCRNDCSFCYYRRSNPRGTRYRKTLADIRSAAGKLAESGVHLIDLTMGEDPLLFRDAPQEGDFLIDQVEAVACMTGLPLMVSPGVVAPDLLKKLKAAGATWYACYQETHSPGVFHRLRPGQDFSKRLEIKSRASGMGFLVEEGVLCGVGETMADILGSIQAMKQLQADQVRVMKFIPQQGTPMEKHAQPASCPDALVIAVLRLVFPAALIPASLDIDGIAGLKARLDAGANVVTSIVPPGEGLSGVARPSLDIEDGRRTAHAVSGILKQWGLRTASVEDYRQWVSARLKTRSGAARRLASKPLKL